MKSKRVESVDLLRGIIMVIMALDHTRDFFHVDAMTGDPLDFASTTPLLYGTRWITHFCAPVFVFLAGTSAWFQSGRKTIKELSSFLLTRGVWIILVDLFVITLITTANYRYDVFVIQVLWSIGISMVILGLAIHLPFKVILALGVLIVAGHNVLDYAEAGRTSFPFWWHLIHKQGYFQLTETKGLFIFYPFLPWTGVMLLGYCFGSIFTKYDEQARSRILMRLGLGAIALFILFRATNLYGDPRPWHQQDTWVKTVMDFMNVAKYPPSLMYLCATLGPAMIFLSLVKHVRGSLSSFFLVFGRVPMFYYILHFFFLSISGITIYLLRGHTWEEGMRGMEGLPFKFIKPGEGFGLGMVYLMWMTLVIVIMYPLCKWYDKYKREHPEKKWLSYL
jgi:uncharacterized membrane protein